MGYGNPNVEPAQRRVTASIDYLVANLEKAPVFVIPCIAPRAQGLPTALQHAMYGSIMPAAWSFMLQRGCGLGTRLNYLWPYYEEEAAQLLDPVAEVMQVALLPVAYTQGSAFRPAPEAAETLIHWETW